MNDAPADDLVEENDANEAIAFRNSLLQRLLQVQN